MDKAQSVDLSVINDDCDRFERRTVARDSSRGENLGMKDVRSQRSVVPGPDISKRIAGVLMGHFGGTFAKGVIYNTRV